VQTSRAHVHQLVAGVLTNLGARPASQIIQRMAICDLGAGFIPIPHWYVLGPFPAPAEDDQVMLTTAGAVGEASAIAGDTNPNLLYDTGTGEKLDWRRIVHADG